MSATLPPHASTLAIEGSSRHNTSSGFDCYVAEKCGSDTKPQKHNILIGAKKKSMYSLLELIATIVKLLPSGLSTNRRDVPKNT